MLVGNIQKGYTSRSNKTTFRNMTSGKGTSVFLWLSQERTIVFHVYCALTIRDMDVPIIFWLFLHYFGRGSIDTRSVVLTREWFLPTRLSRAHVETFRHILGCHNWWWKGLRRTFSRQRPGVLLNIPQFTGQHPTANSCPAQNIRSALDYIFIFILSYNESRESVSRSVRSGSFWPLTCQASLSMKFSRQEYWNG